MEQTINELLKLNIEIEGLLRVVENRDSEYARGILSEKVKAFNALYASLEQAFPLHRNEGSEIGQDDEPSQLAEDSIQKTVEEEANRLTEEEDANATAESSDNSARQEIEAAEDSTSEEETPTQVDNTSTSEIRNTTSIGHEDSLRMDEVLSRREAQDLRRAFTLNDKFRYRRELFGSNDVLFADTLNALSAMQSLDEALNYLYKDLCWDPEDDNVKDFVATVTNHFSAIK